jgi:hypothetical protein
MHVGRNQHRYFFKKRSHAVDPPDRVDNGMAILTNHSDVSLISHKPIIPRKKDKHNDRKLTFWTTAS